jgi:agmatine deiminase
MKISLPILLITLFLSLGTSAQRLGIPNGHAPGEKDLMLEPSVKMSQGIQFTVPPDFEVRTMAEWEEIQSLMITWIGFNHILKQITAAAKEECEVIIFASNVNTVSNYLMASNAGGPAFDNLDNVTIIPGDYNTIWSRDYGAHTVYRNDVDDLVLVDWIYNRNRPNDDAIPLALAEYLGLPLYSTSESPWDLMATGGNFMADGQGTAFSSRLIVNENQGGYAWSGTYYPDHTEEEIDNIMSEFMGIDTYIKMQTLPYDGIHHIDMHMKLLDEETLIIGQYPQGVADGPQIEANIDYVLSNYESTFGAPYEVIRVQMPPEGGSYPNTNGDYRTYANMVFVNKTVIIPVYEEQYDAPALEIIEEALPGYTIVPIQCNDIIQLSGAIHCITKAVGVNEPLLIVHNDLPDTEDDLNEYQVDAIIKHTSDIANASVFYRTSNGAFSELMMNLTNAADDIWTGYIPAQEVGTEIDYYIHSEANSGKQQVRPIVAPEGHWTFNVTGANVGLDEVSENNVIQEIYPNPANSITAIPIELPEAAQVKVSLLDMMGRSVKVIEENRLPKGSSKLFFDAADLAPGAYNVTLQAGTHSYSRRVMVR